MPPKSADKGKARARATPAALSRPTRAKPVEVVDVDDVASTLKPVVPHGKAPPVSWAKHPEWTEELIAYLSNNPDFRVRLFSDSTGDAKKAKREKLIAKDGRPQQYATLALHIFAENPTQTLLYAANPGRFATAVETRLRRLKAEYQEQLAILGATGAGLHPSMIRPGSDAANLIQEIEENWPWWTDLHAFWRELPNYNTIGVTNSRPGTDHAKDAAALYTQLPASDDRGEASDSQPINEEEELECAGRVTLEDLGMFDSDTQFQDMESRDESLFRGSSKSRSSSPNPVTSLKSRRIASTSTMSTTSTATTPSVSSASTRPTKALRAGTVASGHDIGLTKITVGNQNKSTNQKSNKKTQLDKFNESRTDESKRLDLKRKMHHDEEMARAANKKLKLELKVLRAKNEAAALANAAITLHVPRRHEHSYGTLPTSSHQSPRTSPSGSTPFGVPSTSRPRYTSTTTPTITPPIIGSDIPTTVISSSIGVSTSFDMAFAGDFDVSPSVLENHEFVAPSIASGEDFCGTFDFSYLNNVNAAPAPSQ